MFLSTLIRSNYPSLELIFMVPKVFELLKFDCSYDLPTCHPDLQLHTDPVEISPDPAVYGDGPLQPPGGVLSYRSYRYTELVWNQSRAPPAEHSSSDTHSEQISNNNNNFCWNKSVRSFFLFRGCIRGNKSLLHNQSCCNTRIRRLLFYNQNKN